MLAPALELRNIDKAYHSVMALNGASISIAPGSIHGLIGENGAGKSSLMQVAYGLVQPDGGSIFIDGAPVELTTPLQAIERGIGMLHQQASWLEQLSVFDNIMLAEPASGFLFQNKTKALAKLESLRREYGFKFSLTTKLSELDYSQRQLVDVLRSLYRGVRVLILDEPLALLSSTQANYLNSLLVLLKMQGISVVVVSHKLAVLHQLCDVISVIRSGAVTACLDPKQVSLREFSTHMVGREIKLPHPRVEPSKTQAKTLLNILGLGVNGAKSGRKSMAHPLLTRIELSVAQGEIVACVGLPNAGQELLLDVIAGLTRFDAGTIDLLQHQIRVNSRYKIKHARRYGIAYAPSPIFNVGLVEQLSMAESVYLGYQQHGFGRWGFASMKKKHLQCLRLMKDWGIVPRLPALQSGLFSGGNQQKMVLAREMSQQPNLLLLNQPTHGVDAGAVETIYRRLFGMREHGCGILLCSTDLDEVMSLADKICVFSRGRLIETLLAKNTNREELALLIIKEAQHG